VKLSRLGYETHYVFTFYINVLMADLFLVTDFSFDSYVYLCLFSLQLIVVQIQIDSAYFLTTEIAVFRFGLWTQIYFIEKYFYLLKVSVYH
jgi:hypothetical protein